MSLVFNDTSTYKGLVQLYEKEIGATRGDISGNTNRLKEFAADVNIAWDDFLSIALTASGMWQFDDSNHTDYPFITTAITSGQRDYPLTTDEGGNLILDVIKVAIIPSSTATDYVELTPVDAMREEDSRFINSDSGVPSVYDKHANAILLDPIPNYTKAAGLKVYINREASYFTSSDTTKKPGVPGILQKYFYLKPAYEYARRNNLSVLAGLAAEVAKMEGEGGEIAKYFARREKDARHIIKPRPINYI